MNTTDQSTNGDAPSRVGAVLMTGAVVALLAIGTRAAIVPSRNVTTRSSARVAARRAVPTTSASNSVAAPMVAPVAMTPTSNEPSVAAPATTTSAVVATTVLAKAPTARAPRTAAVPSAVAIDLAPRGAEPIVQAVVADVSPTVVSPVLSVVPPTPTPALTTADRIALSLDSAVAMVLRDSATFAPESIASAEGAAAAPAIIPLPSFSWNALKTTPGLTISIVEITDASSGTSGLRNARAVRAFTTVSATLDMDSMLVGWRGLSFRVEHKSKTGRNGSGEAAFMQNYSNIDADDFRSMGEVWVEQRLASNRLRVKAGRVDFNSEFAGTDNGGAFLNASMGFSASIAAAPTFPLPSAGVEVEGAVSDHLSLKAGVFDGRTGAPAVAGRSSRFQILQANQTWTLGAAELAGRVGVGAWRHTGAFAAVTDAPDADPSVKGSQGWFSTIDQTLWQGANRGENGTATISAFAQSGRTARAANVVHTHDGAGLMFNGLASYRPTDALGLGVTKASWTGGRELISEMFYQASVTSHLSLVADWQRAKRFDGQQHRWLGSVFTMRSIVTF
ncbi:MAG: carbohydrate porin [Gemmatimonadaceae bacterium]|nr:carbohydrate porin [Gemmatimonadaceae bacterium]